MKFITGNTKKYQEMKIVFSELEQITIDLPEIQELDPKKVIAAKLAEAQKHVPAGEEIMIEDTSVYIEELNLLPGPFIKWFLDSLGVEGIWNVVNKLDSKSASAKTIIGYVDSNSNIHYFEGSVEGIIVEPRGEGFGWDPLFQPNGSQLCFAEMNIQEKQKYSMRAIAASKLKIFREKE